MRPCRAATALLPAVALLAVGGCAGGTGSSGGLVAAGASGTATGTGTPGSTTPGVGSGAAASAQHWQTALAALAAQASSTRPTGPLAVEAAALAEWNRALAESWPAVRYLIDPLIAQELQRLLSSVGAGGGLITVQHLRNVVIDTAAPPGVVGGGAAPQLWLGLEAPLGATWRISMTANVIAQVTIVIGGVTFVPAVSIDVTVDVSDIRVGGAVTIDATQPERPLLTGAASTPRVDFQLALSSQDPWASQVLAPLTQILHPIVRAAIAVAGVYVQQNAGGLISSMLPATTWGSAAPGGSALPAGTQPLAQTAAAIALEIEHNHMPFGLVYAARFDQPGFGNGQVAGYFDHGDSVDWSGHYLAAEVMRYEMTADPRALATAERIARATLDCLEVAGGDLLSRCVIPLSSPFVQDISGNSSFFVGSVGGVPTGALGDVSRDSYLGSTFGMVQAYLRAPSLRPLARDYVSRNLAYLESHEWSPRMVGSATTLSRASPFSQTPGAMLMLAKAGNLVDRPRWGQLHDGLQSLTSILWLNVWTSSREVHDAYYKYQLAADELYTCAMLETDPALYREHVKIAVILEDAIGFHHNAYHDVMYAAVIPAAGAFKRAPIEHALQAWTARPRRKFETRNSLDPTIAKAPYSRITYGAQGVTLNGPPREYAVHPLPIEKRISGDFLWIQNPFELDGYGDSSKQYPGIDFALPYWLARSYGVLP